jgi:glycerol kinase
MQFMLRISKVQLKALKVDGGGTVSQLLMQFQADMIGVEVVKPVVQETTAMGATFAAGLAVGIWKDLKLKFENCGKLRKRGPHK